MRFGAWYAIAVGTVMILEWAIFLITNQVPELSTEPIRIAFHLAGEFITAVSLIAGGAGIMRGEAWGESVFLVAIGMLFYTAIVSPGYFAQQGQWMWVGIFGLLLLLGLLSVRLVTKTR